MYSTLLHVYTRASLTDILARILARKSARVGQVGVQVGEDRRACPARGKLNGESSGDADILATILARKSAGISVSVSVPWNSGLSELEQGLRREVFWSLITHAAMQHGLVEVYMIL